MIFFKQTRLFLSGLICLCLAGWALPDANAQVRAVGVFKDWQVFTEQVNGDTVCYATVEARDKAPRNATHGPVNFFVSSWKSGKASGQPSLRVGYQLREDLPPEAIVSRSRWRMYAAGDEAFLEDKHESDVIKALKRGSELRIEAVSLRDTRTAYHFSLSGSSAAIDRAMATCR